MYVYFKILKVVNTNKVHRIKQKLLKIYFETFLTFQIKTQIYWTPLLEVVYLLMKVAMIAIEVYFIWYTFQVNGAPTVSLYLLITILIVSSNTYCKSTGLQQFNG